MADIPRDKQNSTIETVYKILINRQNHDNVNKYRKIRSMVIT